MLGYLYLERGAAEVEAGSEAGAGARARVEGHPQAA